MSERGFVRVNKVSTNHWCCTVLNFDVHTVVSRAPFVKILLLLTYLVTAHLVMSIILLLLLNSVISIITFI